MRIRKALYTALLLAGCARVVAPSGGPEDRDPPEIVQIFPEPGFTETLPSRILIEYSERISGEESIVQIYPGNADIVVKNRSMEITPENPQGIFTITISGDLQDVRGNRTAEPVTLVWNSVPEEGFAGLRALVSRSGGGNVTETSRCDFFLLPDTSAPILTQFPDSSGSLTAGWLPEGEYRLLCYEDNDRSRSWDPEREAGASRDISLLPGDTAQVSLSMSIIDSIGPVISSVEAIDGWHLEIQWNEQISTPAQGVDYVTLTGPDSLAVPIYGLSSSAGRSSTGRITVYTGQLQDTLYTIRVSGIEDLSGNPSLPDSLELWATDSLPSFAFSVQSAYPEDGAIDIPPSGPFLVSFSDWVDLNALDSLYTVSRVFDEAQVPGSLVRTSPLAFSFIPESDLLGDRQYRIDLDSGLVSLQGDTLGGRSWTFKPAWSNSPGSLSGALSGTSAPVILVVVTSAGGGDTRVTGEFARGDFIIGEIPGGRYTVSCFVDWNRNAVWDPGEPYGAWPGVIEVYPGIETTGVNIQVVP